MRARVKAGPMPPKSGAPKSIEAAEAADKLKDKIGQNTIGKGEAGTKPPEPVPDGAPTRAEKRRLADEEKKRLEKIRRGPKQSRLGKAEKEPELPGMPGVDGPGKAARQLLDAVDAEETAKDNVVACRANVVLALKKAKRSSISVDGCTIKVEHKEAVDVVKIVKPKGK